MWDKEPTASSPPSLVIASLWDDPLGDAGRWETWALLAPKNTPQDLSIAPSNRVTSTVISCPLPSLFPIAPEEERVNAILRFPISRGTRRECHGLGPSSSPNHLTPTICSSCFSGSCPAPLQLTLLRFNLPETLLWSCHSPLPVSPWSTENEFKYYGCMECILVPTSFPSSTLYFSSINPHIQPNGSQYLCLLHFPDVTSAVYPIPTQILKPNSMQSLPRSSYSLIKLWSKGCKKNHLSILWASIVHKYMPWIISFIRLLNKCIHMRYPESHDMARKDLGEEQKGRNYHLLRVYSKQVTVPSISMSTQFILTT